MNRNDQNRIVIFFFYAIPFIWFALSFAMSRSLYFESNSLWSVSSLWFIASVLFFGFTHVGAAFHFLVIDSLGREWWQSLEDKRRSQLMVKLVAGAIGIICFFGYQILNFKFDPKLAFEYFGMWTAWHGVRQSESLLKSISSDTFTWKVIEVYRMSLMTFVILRISILSSLTFDEIKIVSFILGTLIAVLIFRLLFLRDFKGAIFSFRFLISALQFSFPIVAIGTFAVHGTEYMYVNSLLSVEKRKSFVMLMLGASAIIVALYLNLNHFYQQIFLCITYLCNYFHYVLDGETFKYRFEFERKNFLPKLKF